MPRNEQGRKVARTATSKYSSHVACRWYPNAPIMRSHTSNEAVGQERTQFLVPRRKIFRKLPRLVSPVVESTASAEVADTNELSRTCPSLETARTRHIGGTGLHPGKPLNCSAALGTAPSLSSDLSSRNGGQFVKHANLCETAYYQIEKKKQYDCEFSTLAQKIGRQVERFVRRPYTA